MPARRASGSRGRPIEVALAALVRALEVSRAPWMIIGGIAIIARGVRRMTTDIDAAVRGDAVTPRRLLDTLGEQAIEPRIPGVEAFARKNLVLLVRHVPTGVDLDISLAWSGFELAALEARTKVKYGRVGAFMATAEDLVIFKAVAARPRDLEDAEALLTLYPNIDVVRVRRDVEALAELAGAEEIVAGFEWALARARRAKPSRR